MTLIEAMRWMELFAFSGLAVIAVWQWSRRRTTTAAWLALTFVALGGAVFLGRWLPEGGDGMVNLVAVKAVVVTLAMFPYCLYRFSISFSPRLRRRIAAATVAAASIAVATAALPRFPAEGEPSTPLFMLYTLAFVVYWTALSLVSAVCLWMAGRNQPAVARRRMGMLATASVALNGGLVMLAGVHTPTVGMVMARRSIGFAAALLFLLAFAPPRSLRTVWRRVETERLRAAEADLLAALTSSAVGRLVLPNAVQVVGAKSAILVDERWRLIGFHGIDEAAAADLACLLEPLTTDRRTVVETVDLLAIPLRAGWLALQTQESSPFIGPDELSILRNLGHLTGLALDRADLFERNESARAALEEREAQLADAQRTARLGSYRWDLRTGDISCSDELHRLFGLVPGTVDDFRADFASRVHPEDRKSVQAFWDASRQSHQPTSMEYRLLLPDRTLRWVHARTEPHLAHDGEPVRLTGTIQDITDRRKADETMAFQARYDALTRLPNRMLFLARLVEAQARRTQRSSGLAVLFLDIDRFKWLNDSLGHAAGDQLLMAVAGRLGAAVRPGDTVARFGGDEFVVMCEDVSSEAAAEAMADRVAAALERPIVIGNDETVVTVSIGIAYSPAGATDDTPETLLRDADAAMYQAKELGRDRRETFTPATREHALARHEMANALHRGIDRGDLVVHYQPEIDITTGRVVAVEALVRWMHPERGLLAPGEFIPLAEESGLIVRLGARVLHDACQQVVQWQPAAGEGAPISVAVNLAARQLLSPDLCATVTSALSSSGLDPSLLCIEITESVLLEDASTTARALQALKALGVRIAVDDFGTGFSSLTYLKRFPVDILKIDKSFVEGVGVDREDCAIVASVVDLAHAFGLTTIAEGIETEEQLAELRRIGCEQGQGYLWSKALPPEEVRRWISARASEAEAAAGTVEAAAGSAGQAAQRVLIVEDDRSLRKFLRTLFDGCDGYVVVGEADDGREAIALARHHAPDIVLLDLAMPGMGGLEALPLIGAVAPGAKVIVLSGLDAADMAGTATRRGAAAYFTKGRDPNELLDLLQAAAATPA